MLNRCNSMKTDNFTIPTEPVCRLAVMVLAVCLAAPANASVDRAFDARYGVEIDGKPRVEARISMKREGEAWSLVSHSSGTRGLARMLRLNSHESTELEFSEAGILPHRFQHHTRVAGRDDRWSAQFEHDRGVLVLEHEEGVNEFNLDQPVFDPLSLTLELRRRLALGEAEFEFRVADEDEVEVHRYRAGTTEFVQTPAGCFEAVPVERIRSNSTRFSTGWYAAGLAWIPVRVEHGKRGGKTFDMRLQQLELDGNPVPPAGDCKSAP